MDARFISWPVVTNMLSAVADVEPVGRSSSYMSMTVEMTMAIVYNLGLNVTDILNGLSLFATVRQAMWRAGGRACMLMAAGPRKTGDDIVDE